MPQHPRDAFEEISFYLGRVYYDHLRVIEQLLAERGLDDVLGTGMGQILFTLYQQDGCIIKDLSRTLRMSPSRLTTMLERMEDAGLITRKADGADRRAVRIRLTRLGRSLEADCRAILHDVNEILAAGFSDAEVAEVRSRLAHMIANLAAYRARSDASAAAGHTATSTRSSR